MLKVFLSSTAKDLEPYRAAVDAVIRKLDGLHSIRMEDWTARPNTPRETCEAEVRGSDLFIGILGHCYGSSPPDDPRSFTEIEYDTAVGEELRRLMFVATDDFPVAVSLLRAESPDQGQRQEAFRKRVLATDTAARNFRTPDELAAGVRDALWNELQRRKAHAPNEPERQPLCTLPGRLGDFTGRGRELDQLCAALTTGERRAAVWAVGGMGGVGKTTLAVEAAWRVAGEFLDGVLFVDLRGFGQAPPLTPEQEIAAVAAQLEPTARLPEGLDALLPLYRRLLAGRRLLLVLDNARDLAQVKDLVPPPPTALLVTSRHQLLLPGARSRDLDVLPLADAMALLREVLAGRPVEEGRLATLAERCGRLPLALRAADSYLRTRPGLAVEAYLALLADERKRLEYLKVPRAELDVWANLRLSVTALEEDDPALAERWRMLAVFPAGFLPNAAAAVWQVAEEEAGAALDELAGRALVGFEGESGRYRLHDLVRDLAAAELGEAVREEAAARHAAHYVAVLGRADDLYLARQALAGLALFDAERANVEAGQAWAAGRAASRDAAARHAYGYTDAGAYVLFLRQPPRHQVAWLEAALAACRRLGDRRGEGNTLGNLGNAWYALGEPRNAAGYHEQNLAVAREIGDRRGESSVLGNLGVAWKNLGEPRKAVGYYEQQLVVVREIGDRHGESNALGNLGNAWKILGEPRKAVGYHEQALVISREIGDRHGEGQDLGNLGFAWEALGERDKAVKSMCSALAILRQIESPNVAIVESWLRQRGIDRSALPPSPC